MSEPAFVFAVVGITIAGLFLGAWVMGESAAQREIKAIEAERRAEYQRRLSELFDEGKKL